MADLVIRRVAWKIRGKDTRMLSVTILIRLLIPQADDTVERDFLDQLSPFLSAQHPRPLRTVFACFQLLILSVVPAHVQSAILLVSTEKKR